MSECEEIAKNIYRLKTKKIQSLKNAEMKTTRYEDLSLNHPDFFLLVLRELGYLGKLKPWKNA